MTTTETVIERIAVEIVNRLSEITLDNGYTFNAVNVIRNDRLGTYATPEHHLMEVVQDDSTRVEELDCPGNPPALAFETMFHIHCYVRESDTLATEVASSTNEALGQMVKAITHPSVSPSTWYTFGGNAVECSIETLKRFRSSDGTHAGGTLEIKTIHRQSEIDAYAGRA
jgi:hypothetical protein